MKNKILCFTLILSVFLSLFCITSFAADEPAENDTMVIPAGTYVLNDVLSPLTSSNLPTGGNILFDYYSNGVRTVKLATSAYYAEGSDWLFQLDFMGWEFEATGKDGNITAYVSSNIDEYNLGWVDPSFKTFIFDTDVTTTINVGTWFLSNTYDPNYPTLSSGYYRLSLPIDIEQPTWIGDRNTVWFNMRGRVITDDSNRALSFYRLGIRYFVNEGVDYGAGAWGIELRVDTNTDTNLEVMSILFDRNTNQFYWGYNDLVLDSFVGIALDGDYGVDNDFFVLFNSLFEPYEYVYTGNPWFDIVDGVVDALKIDVFGSFSPWDILVTFIGISVFIWLLKLLAGG